MTQAPQVKAEKRGRRLKLWNQFLDGFSTFSVYAFLIGGIVLGKVLKNYRQGMSWKQLTLPTSLDMIVSVVVTLPTTAYFENAGKRDEAGKVRQGYHAGKRRNVIRRCFQAFFTGIGTQALAGGAK